MIEFKGDKRTKEYKAWKAKYEKKPAGLGDVVEKFTKATGIKTFVEAVTDNCGCEERKLRWNEKYSFKMKNPLTEEEYNIITTDIENKKNTFTPKDQEVYKDIFERVFETRVDCTPCSFKKTIWEKLSKAVTI